MVAQYLNEHHIGTLLFDLLTEKEDEQYQNRFDIDLLTKRLIGATEWVEEQESAKDCALGYFGASTGAACALRAAEQLPQVRTVISRGGRPDLAGAGILKKITCPTLLIVGGKDDQVLELNRQAFYLLPCDKKLEVVSGATHLFEERGAMEKVCELSASWFTKQLQPVQSGTYRFFELLL
jgi:dienelactone hydrolase